jgi:iron complex transport system ATP-binding protein
VLSQGERQRVLISRALMAKPRVLILDEPCAGLDLAAREHFLQFLQRLGAQKHSPTLVLVTHHVEEIMPVFSHLLILKNGRMLASGEKLAILKTKILSQAFNAQLKLQFKTGRYLLSVLPEKGAAV